MKTEKHSQRGWIAAALLAVTLTASAAVEVKTLGGGPNERSAAKAGFGNGNTLTEAKFNQPYGIAVQRDGSLVIADRNNGYLRDVSDPGNDAASFTSVIGPKSKQPVSVAVDRNGFIYSIITKPGSVRVMSPNGDVVQTFGGFNKPTAVAVDSSTNIYVADGRGTSVRILTWDGSVTDLASGFSQISGLALLDTATLGVSDARAHAIYAIDLVSGEVRTVAGGNGPGASDGPVESAQFNSPAGLVRAPNGRIFVADRLNHRVRVIETNGLVRTVYGGSRASWTKPWQGWEDGDETTALAREPLAVAIGTNNALYVTEKYWNIIREVTGPGLTGGSTNTGGGTNGQILVAVPTFTPSSGFFPMGVTITVTSTVPVFYTTDGTEPTTNSRQVTLVDNVGTIRFTETQRDLTSLRLRAFDGTNASAIVSGQAAPVNEVGIPRDFNAGVGSVAVVPVILNLRTNDRVRSIQFRVEVTPINGGPAILPQFRAISMSSNDFVPVTTAAAANTIAVYNAQPYTLPGNRRGLFVSAIGTNANFDVQRFATAAMLAVPIDPSASEGHLYSIDIIQPSATSDGQQNIVPVAPMPTRTLTVANIPYLVGDSSPGYWYNAGDYGDGDLRNDDVNNVFYASHGVRIPFEFSDVFNAMDAWPEDPMDNPFIPGGDRIIDQFDFEIIRARSIRLNGTNFLRWRGGIDGRTVSQSTTLPGSVATVSAAKAAREASTPKNAAAADYGPGAVWVRQATLRAGSIENAIPGELYEIPVWIEVASGCRVSGLSIRVAVRRNGTAPQVSDVAFEADHTSNYIFGHGIAPNELLCSWLMLPTPAFSPALAGKQSLGVIKFRVPPGAPAGSSYSIRFLKISGGADMSNPYQFDSIPGSVGVFTTPSQEVTADEWRHHFFGTNTPSAELPLDADEDGISNAQEYRDGTNPADAGSKLFLTQRNVSGEQGSVIELEWLSAPLKRYMVERGNSTTGPWTILAKDVDGDGNSKVVIDSTPSENAPFYRITVQP